MKIESIRLKNFKSFKDVGLRDLPRFCVLIEANGTGRLTFSSLFEFLKAALSSNIHTALAKLGRSKGFTEVHSRGADGNIEIELKFQERRTAPLVTYSLSIGERGGFPVVESEVLKYRRGSSGRPWHFLDFSHGSGYAVTNELNAVTDVSQLERQEQTLKSPDILVIKGLAQFKSFPAVIALGNLIEHWHTSDFHIDRARPEQEAGYAEHLSAKGENLALVTDFLYTKHRGIFDKILEKLARHIPGLSQVDAKITETGRVSLRFQDGAFRDRSRHAMFQTARSRCSLT